MQLSKLRNSRPVLSYVLLYHSPRFQW